MPNLQGDLIALTITGLTDQGDGVGHASGQAVFVPQAVPGDQLEVRLIRVKTSHAFGQIQAIIEPSPERVQPGCLVAAKCGGCQWQSVSAVQQATSKQQIVRDALERLGGLDLPELAPFMTAPAMLHYRNKATYPIVPGQEQPLRLGYYRPKSHQVVSLNQCPVQDQRLDPLLRALKQDLQQTGWPAYDETTHRGLLRHLSLRIGRRSGEILITLVVCHDDLPGLDAWAAQWLERHPAVVGVCLNLNRDRGNVIFGRETICVAGQPTLREHFAGVDLAIDSTSFFQIYTEQAERLWSWLVDKVQLNGNATVIDAYCGIGTMSLPLARSVRRVIGIESWPAAVARAEANARLNGIENAEFRLGTVEVLLPTLPEADLVMLDPPRKGCDRQVLDTLLAQQPATLAYISCNPATLARDLKVLSQGYAIAHVQAADFFPQTAHVETAVILQRR